MLGILGAFDGVALCSARRRDHSKVDGLEFDTELRIAFEYHLLPLDLPEHVVLHHDHAHLQLVFHQRRDLSHQHGEAAIANNADDLPTGISDRRANAVGQPIGHRCQRARQRKLHGAADVHMSRSPCSNRAAVRRDNGIVVQQLVERVRNNLRLHGHIFARAAFFHQLKPALHAFLRLLQKLVVLFLEQRQQCWKDALGVAKQADIDRVTEADAGRINLDLHTLCLPGLG